MGKRENGEMGENGSRLRFSSFQFRFSSFEKPIINRLMKRGAVMLSEAKHLLSH